MISFLQGRPLVNDDELILLVSGVGYGVRTTPQLLGTASLKEEISIYVYTHVREDLLELFGFETKEEKRLFMLLLSVSGVGPSTALNITAQGASRLTQAVQEADLKFFSSVPRVGKKLGQKIIIELKSKLGSLKELDLSSLTTKQKDVVDVLVGLGYELETAEEVVKSLEVEEVTIQAAVKLAIKSLHHGG